MDNLFKEALGEALVNILKEDAGYSSDIAQWEPLIFPLIHKIYPDSLVEQIASVQPTKAPSAKVAYLNTLYTGNESNMEGDIHWMNSRIITLPASADGDFAVSGTYVDTTAGVSLKVFYKQIVNEYVTYEVSSGLTETISGALEPKYLNLVVAEVTGTLDYDPATLSGSNPIGLVLAGDTFNGHTILYTSTNKNTIKKVFKDYSSVLENNSNLREINFEPVTKTIDTFSRKIRSKFTPERLQDFKSLYGEKAYDLVAEAIANEIRQEIDREIIEYLKTVATPMKSDINLPLSLGMQSGFDAMTYDIAGSIFLAAEEIIKATKRNRTMFILADSATCSFLLLNPFHAHPVSDDGNPYKVGKFGAYDLYCDPYSTEHYVIVGYTHNSKEKYDAGLYFVPYTTSVHEVQVGDNSLNQFGTNFMVMNRYGYTVNPQDSGHGDADSDFFRIFSVNFGDGSIAVPNFPEQFRTNY